MKAYFNASYENEIRKKRMILGRYYDVQNGNIVSSSSRERECNGVNNKIIFMAADDISVTRH